MSLFPSRILSAALAALVLPAAARTPKISIYQPKHGAVGDRVTLAGEGFEGATAVTLGGVPAAFKVREDHLLTFPVPKGALTGPIVVRTPEGTARSSGVFTVDSAAVASGPRIGGWYLTQSVQTLDRKVPLVAGRDALLRVFVLGGGATPPAVRVTVTGGEPSPWEARIPPPPRPKGEALDEGDLAASWNLKVPGKVITPWSTVTLHLDPGTGAPALAEPLQAQALPVYKLTVVPVAAAGRVANVTDDGRALGSWVERFQRMYGVVPAPAGLEVRRQAPYTTQVALGPDGSGWSGLLSELARKRVVEGGTSTYYGAVAVAYGTGLAGVASQAGGTAVGWDKSGYPDGGNYPEVLAHLLGHSLGLAHAPCGVELGDPEWPRDGAHGQGRTGAFGYDPATGDLMSPAHADIMSHCRPAWISDYTYRRALARLQAPRPEPAPVTRCLLVSGRMKHGKVTLDPGFTVDTAPCPPGGHEYTLELLGADGGALLRVPFSPTEVADVPGGGERQFAFAVPVENRIEKALRTLRVASDRGVLAMRQGGWTAPPGEPQAEALGRGRVRVTWPGDGAVLIRDGATVLAMATGGSVEVVTASALLTVDLSNGVVSTTFKLRVPPRP